MRFRTVATGNTLSWAVLALFWIAMSSANLRHDLVRHNHGEAQFHIVILACWALILLLYLYMYLFSRLEFEPAALRLHTGFRSIVISYDNIVAARPAFTAKGKPLRNTIELETARLSPDIYPHDYRRLAVADPSAFIRALSDKAPQAETDPA